MIESDSETHKELYKIKNLYTITKDSLRCKIYNGQIISIKQAEYPNQTS